MSEAVERNFNISDEDMKVIETGLQQYEESVVGLPKLVEMATPRGLTISTVDLRKMSPGDLADIGYELGQYNMYIQRLINKERGWEIWAKSKLEEVSGSLLSQIEGNYGYNERMLMAKTQHSYCRKLNGVIRDTQMKTSRLWGIPEHIRDISNRIRDIRFINKDNHD